MRHSRILVPLAFIFCFWASAQRNDDQNHHRGPGHHGQFHKDLTADQLATLKTKKMVLNLDLNSSQQTAIYQLNLDQAKERKAHFEERQKNKDSKEPKKPSAEERFNRINGHLDAQIAYQEKIKGILTPEQYQTWKETQRKRHQGIKHKARKRSGRGE